MSPLYLLVAAAAFLALAGVARAQQADGLELFSSTAPVVTAHRSVAEPRARPSHPDDFGSSSAAHVARTLGY